MRADALQVDLPAGYSRPERLHERDGILVVRAYETRAARPVVLKVCTGSAPAYRREQFDREAAVLERHGGHPHVVTLLGRTSTTDGHPALVLERCSATPPPRPPNTHLGVAVSAVVKLAGAVESVHVGGVLHCAVAPRHVLWTGTGDPALSGFGASVDRGDPAGVLHDSDAYTAPELLLGALPGASTDVYGLGVTLFRLVAGRPPFPAYAGESAAALSLRIVRGDAERLGADVPLELADLIRWAMALDPADRPPSAAWLGDELGGIERRLGLRRTRMTIGPTRRPRPR